MSITSVTANTDTSVAGNPTKAQARKDFQALTADLRAGNVAGAQTDFAALMQDAPQLQGQLQANPTAPSSTALNSLSSALQSGDVAGAQSALATLQQLTHGHHHHHHRSDQDDAPATSPTTPTTPVVATS